MPLNGVFGRRIATAVGFGFAFMGMLGLCFFRTVGIYQIVMGNIAKFGSTLTFNAIFLYCAELFPTSLRSVTSGSSNSAARVGALLSPLFAVFLTEAVNGVFVAAFCAIVAFVGMLATLASPETQNIQLVDH